MKKEDLIEKLKKNLEKKIKLDIEIEDIYVDKKFFINNKIDVIYIKIKKLELKEDIEIQHDMFNAGFIGIKDSILNKLEMILNKKNLFKCKFVDNFDNIKMDVYKNNVEKKNEKNFFKKKSNRTLF